LRFGGNSSTEYKGLLAYHLNTTIPTRGIGFKIHLCHLCGNGKCSNPKHLYWGTASENFNDRKIHGTFTSVYEHTLKKYGKEKILEIASLAGKAAGEANRKPQEYWESYRIFFNNVDMSKRGWVTELAKQMNVSHTHVRRIAKKLNLLGTRMQCRDC
jgi:hypothetical protein